jgi:hypothetical protein
MSLSQCTALKLLRVQNNQLSGSLEVLSGCRALENLAVDDNLLSSALPQDLAARVRQGSLTINEGRTLRTKSLTAEKGQMVAALASMDPFMVTLAAWRFGSLRSSDDPDELLWQ